MSPDLTSSQREFSDSSFLLSASKRAIRASGKSFLSSVSRSLVPKPLWRMEG